MKKIFKVTALSGLLTLLKMIMGFIIAKIIAIYTGPAGMAMLGQIQSIINSFNGIINSPVSSGIVRFTAENHSRGYDKCSPWWRASLEWMIVLCAVLIPLGVLSSDLLSTWLLQTPDYSWTICLIVIFLPLSALGTFIISIINGLESYRRYITLIMISVIISSAIMVLMIIYAGIRGALIAAIIQSSLIGLIMLIGNIKQPWFMLHYLWGETHSKARKDIAGYIIMAITTAITAPLSLILVRNLIITQVGWEQAGQWQAVWKISEVYLSVITIALGTYYLPKLSALIGSEIIIKEINRTAIYVIPFAIILASIVYIFRDFIIHILFTPDFKPARDLFMIQLCGDVIKIASWLYAYPMLSRGATKWYVLTEILFAITFVAFAWLFINIVNNAHGANYAYLLNYIIYLLFILLNFKRIVR